MDETMLNQQMRELIAENRAKPADENGEDLPMGYAWLLKQAEEGPLVPVPLYRELWVGLQRRGSFPGVQERECAPDPEDAAKPMFTTDVTAVSCAHAAMFEAETLKKEAILNPDALPVDPKTGEKSWGILLDDVWRKGKHAVFAVDGKALRGLDGEGYTAVLGMPLAEAKQRDDLWREKLKKGCYARYLNRLGELAVTKEEKQYVLGLMAKAQLLRLVSAEQLQKPTLE